MEKREIFDEKETLHRLKHYLPSQAPLKDFVHHNTLHAFQNMNFEDGTHMASEIFGYKVTLSLEEYRDLFKHNRIREEILEDRIIRKKGIENADAWIYNVLHKEYDNSINHRIGELRDNWKNIYSIDLNSEVHTTLFKLLNSYLDQGIAIWKFPANEQGFISSLRYLEKKSFASFLRSKRCKAFLMDKTTTITQLLKILVEDEDLFEQYLFDQQFSHPGWSGIVAEIESRPESLMDHRAISLRDLIILDLILEIDALDSQFKEKWEPLGKILNERPAKLFDPVTKSEKDEAVAIWQEAFEWSYYDQVLAGIQKMKGRSSTKPGKSFQALFCIDDREGSIRRHLETIDKKCETYATPGFFGIEFYYQPENGKFYSKVCPAPVTPKYLIKEHSDGFR